MLNLVIYHLRWVYNKPVTAGLVPYIFLFWQPRGTYSSFTGTRELELESHALDAVRYKYLALLDNDHINDTKLSM